MGSDFVSGNYIVPLSDIGPDDQESYYAIPQDADESYLIPRKHRPPNPRTRLTAKERAERKKKRDAQKKARRISRK